MSADLLETARSAMALAKKAGASDAAATADRSREVETTWRDGKLEKVSDATSRSVSLALYVDGRYGVVSTSDLRPDALAKFVTDATQMMRALAPDPHRKLPDPATYADRTTADLEIFDPKIANITTEWRLERARAMEEAARSVRGKENIVSVTTSVGDSVSEIARVASNGFEGSYRSGYVSAGTEVSVKDADGRRPEDGADADVRQVGDLPDVALVGREAAERTLARLGSRKMASGTIPIVVEARAARALFRHFVGPMSGSAIQQKSSFFEGKVGASVASKTLTLTDEPLLRRGLASRPFDGEGMTSRARTFIDRGVLRDYFLDVYYANKLGMKPTTAGGSNLVIRPGERSLDALLRDMKEGILVTGFLGGNSNATTGVFSLGLSGYRVAHGERKEPIGEMNLSGRHLDVWQKLVAVGNDPYVFSSTRTPSLAFEGLSVAGT